MKPAKVCQVIAACAVLHNIGIKRRKEGDEQTENEEKENDNDACCSVNACFEGLESGQIFRNNFVPQHFAHKDRRAKQRGRKRKNNEN